MADPGQIPESGVTVAFLHVDHEAWGPQMALLADGMVASVRKHMPGSRIVQLTDTKSARRPGVDAVMRRPMDRALMRFRTQMFSLIETMPAIRLDTDVLVQGDLATAFVGDWQLGLTHRDTPIVDRDTGEDVAQTMPYNGGVVFFRDRGAALTLADIMAAQTFDEATWWGDQMSLKALADEGRFKTRVFDCSTWNHTPMTKGEDVSEKMVVHYKGEKRKAWMLERIAKEYGIS